MRAHPTEAEWRLSEPCRSVERLCVDMESDPSMDGVVGRTIFSDTAASAWSVVRTLSSSSTKYCARDGLRPTLQVKTWQPCAIEGWPFLDVVAFTMLNMSARGGMAGWQGDGVAERRSVGVVRWRDGAAGWTGRTDWMG